MLKSRQHLLNEAESLLVELPLELREALPDTSEVRPRLAALVQVKQDRWDAVTRLRLRLLADHAVAVDDLDAREKETIRELREGDGEPIRHRYNPDGNRGVNAVLHRMAVTQLRCEPRARKIYDDARRRGHTKPEAMRVLKRHLSDVVYRRMLQDLKRRLMEGHSGSAAA